MPKPWMKDGKLVVDSSGKVILCDTCPCTPCCMYPWPDPNGTNGGPFYPPEDLPDFIDRVDSGGGFIETLSHDVGLYTYTGATYKIIAGPFIGALEWRVSAPGGTAPFKSYGNCLIRDDVAHDQFSTTYTVNGTDIITRVDPCTWTGGSWTLHYNSSTYTWQLNGVDKTAPQSDPTGNYGGNTVS